MKSKLLLGFLCLCMTPFMQGCDDDDVAAGAVTGAVVGGTIAAVASDNYSHDRYYYNRYNNYYRYRRAYYGRSYGSRYYGPRYYGTRYTSPYYSYSNDMSVYDRTRYDRRFSNAPGGGLHVPIYRGGSRTHGMITPTAAKPGTRLARTPVEKFANFYQMPMASARIIWTAQQKALKGDASGLSKLGLFKGDVQRLVKMQPASRDTLYRMSLRTGLSEAHARDLLLDFQNELKASREAGRVSL